MKNEYNEHWESIPEFPNYSISTRGRVWNERFDREMSTSVTSFGHAKVSLVNEYGRRTMSVPLLMAQAFIQPPDALSNAVIMLDGNPRNLDLENLALRPRWFAWKYARQLNVPSRYPFIDRLIYNIDLDETSSVFECCTKYGLLFMDVWKSPEYGNPVYPYRWRFERV